jgi:hypothetical protein
MGHGSRKKSGHPEIKGRLGAALIGRSSHTIALSSTAFTTTASVGHHQAVHRHFKARTAGDTP